MLFSGNYRVSGNYVVSISPPFLTNDYVRLQRVQLPFIGTSPRYTGTYSSDLDKTAKLIVGYDRFFWPRRERVLVQYTID